MSTSVMTRDSIAAPARGDDMSHRATARRVTSRPRYGGARYVPGTCQVPEGPVSTMSVGRVAERAPVAAAVQEEWLRGYDCESRARGRRRLRDGDRGAGSGRLRASLPGHRHRG